MWVSTEAWAAAQATWWHPERVGWEWTERRWRWLHGRHGPGLPLDLAVIWVADEAGITTAAHALAALASATVRHDKHGVLVTVIQDGER